MATEKEESPTEEEDIEKQELSLQALEDELLASEKLEASQKLESKLVASMIPVGHHEGSSRSSLPVGIRTSGILEEIPIPLPIPPLERVPNVSRAPGAYAVQTANPGRAGSNRVTTEETEGPSPEDTTGTTPVAAELSPDVDALEAERDALKEQLQALEEQQDNLEVAEAVVKDGSRTTWYLHVSFWVIVMALALVVTLALMLPNKDHVDLKSSLNATSPRFQELQSILDPLYGTNLESADRQAAMRWLADEDEAQLDFTTVDSYELHQRYTMALLYYSTEGWDWNRNASWLGPDPICQWENLHCDEETNTTLVNIAMAKNKLRGTIPDELGSLTKLTRCDVWKNVLTGLIPTELGELTLLEDLSFGSNSLSGTLPSELGNLENLWFFSGTGNALTGTIPTEFGRLQSLELLFLAANSLSGTLPSEMSAVPLTEFHFHENFDMFGDINPLFCSNLNGTDTDVKVGADCLGNNSNIECSCCAFCCNMSTC